MTKKTIDIVTTGLIRPELLDLTYKSFLNGISNLPPVRIIINIDPLGGSCANQSIEVVKKYCNNPIIRTPSTPSFMEAIKWCWSQVESDYFIHLEDDWILNKRVDFNDWRNSLNKDDIAQSVLLMKKPEQYIYSFRPHLAKSSVCKLVADLPEKGNPEKEIARLVTQYGLRSVTYGGAYCITDTGRKWAKHLGLIKQDQGIGSWFKATDKNILRAIEYRLHMAIWKSQAGKMEENNVRNN